MAPRNKLLLLQPPFYRLFHERYALQRYPLSLGYLAAAALGADWEVRAYNADFQPGVPARESAAWVFGEGHRRYRRAIEEPRGGVWDEVARAIRDFAPAVVGITAMTQNWAAGRVVARMVKEIDPAIRVVVGGPHPSMAGAACFACPDIDFAVAGEGDATLAELLAALAAEGDPSQVAGLLWRGGGGVLRTPPRPLLDNLDALPFPALHAPAVLQDYALYPSHAFMFVAAGRGCPWDCAFCGSREIWGRAARLRSPRHIVYEIALLVPRGVMSVRFEDDTFGLDRSHLRELCALIAAEYPRLTWGCQMRADLVDEETVRLMRDAGCIDSTPRLMSMQPASTSTWGWNRGTTPCSAACAKG